MMKTLLLLSCLASATAQAASCQIDSPAKAQSLLELYTSEGCDSCPPADRWLSQLKGQSAAVVPLAFHVTYWDYIGWPDRFASKQFDLRHKQRVHAQGSNSVYTPQLMLNGRDHLAWRSLPPTQAAVNNIEPPRFNLQASLDKNLLKLNLSGPSANTYKVAYAVTENNLSSQVKAGENKGVMLKHDFVVRQWLANQGLGASQLAIPADAKRSELAVTAVIEQAGGGLVQVFSLPLQACL
jgi:hypothetical protein